MGYPKQVYVNAWQALERRRTDMRSQNLARREEVLRAVPEIGVIERQMAQQAAGVTKAVIGNPNAAAQMIRELGEKNQRLQDQRRRLLQEAGFPPDYLEERFSCGKCRDTGYVGIEMCSCLRELINREAVGRLGAVTPVGQCTFSDFALTFYPESPMENGIVPRKRMGEVLEVCMRYADDFSPHAESLLLIGQTGLGKTHLSIAIARAVTEKGYGVIYTPVQRLMDRLEAEKFSRDPGLREEYLGDTRSILECDLLILDDLGTEFSTSFTSSALYNIINGRLVENRSTIISTNLDLKAIEQHYSQRMVSRLVCGYKVLKFYGKDIRYIRKMQEL